jgi:hypothetical protein
VFSSRIVVRWDGLNIGFFLLHEALRQTVELPAEVFDLPASGLALVGVQGGGLHAPQSSLSAVQNRGRHVQIALQGGGPGRGRLRFGWRLGFEEQLGLVEQTLADQGRGVAPGRIQLPGLPRIAAMPSEHGGHALAVLQADTGHRHQELHRHVGGDSAVTHLLLDGFRQKIDQG